jgi:hypothetical protein
MRERMPGESLQRWRGKKGKNEERDAESAVRVLVMKGTAYESHFSCFSGCKHEEHIR